MKLVAIYNTWGDFDLLQHSIKNIRPLVDAIIVVFSRTSNYGEELVGKDGSNIDEWLDAGCPVWFVRKEPDNKINPMQNETDKRNFGLDFAKSMKRFTHFLTIDADELYEHEPFLKEKERFNNSNIKGLVCLCQTYFKSPTLTIGLDRTLVPFIHELTPTIQHAFNRSYPFAWRGRDIFIDPTRSLNISSGVEMSGLIMHHYSWVRKDIEIKIRNSTARANIERSTLRKDFALAKEGYFVEYYGKTLIRASVDFNIPEFDVPDIQKPLAAETSPQPEDS